MKHYLLSIYRPDGDPPSTAATREVPRSAVDPGNR